jgi:polyisoprenyl-phosphate glycosyltransferase
MQAPEQHIEPMLPLPFPLERRDVARPRVCIVLPVFNEEAVLEKTYQALKATLETLPIDWQLLFVNDGSRDGTAGVLEKLYRMDQRIAYVLLSRNFGHQAALTAGFDNADADVIVCMDADLQHPPELLPIFLEAWRQGYDVIHTRKLLTEGLPFLRRIVTDIAYAAIERVSQVKIIPNASDYRLLDREALDAVKNLPERTRLYRGLTPWVGFRQCVIPYVAAERAAGRSQYGIKQLFGLFARGLFDFSSAPLHVGLVLGGIAVGLSTLYFLFILVWLLVGEETPPGWASTVSVTMMLSSVSLLFSGIIGVYVARIYDEVRARPPYVSLRIRKHDKRSSDGA